MTSNDHTRNQFESGNYGAVAQNGDNSNWRTYAARGLIGPDNGHVERLSAFDGEEENFYRAVLHWMNRDEKVAISILEQSSFPAAQRLLKILGTPKIKVISQIIEDSASPFALFRGVSRDERFEVTNIDFQPHPGREPPSIDVMDHVDPSNPPAFFISSMVEWNPFLDNLEHLDCPIFGHTHDIDMVFQTVQPLLQQFDELIVFGAAEKTAIERLTGKQAIVYPHVHALDDGDLPELSQLKSNVVNIDVVITGTTVDYFHPDKREFISHLLKSQYINPLIVHGFLPKKMYFQIYNSARVITSLSRFVDEKTRSFATETRFVEALAVGRPIFALRGSALDRLASDYNGIYHFEKKSETIEQDLTHAIIREKLEPMDRVETAKQFRLLYGHHNIGSRYLRFLTFRAAMNEAVKRTTVHKLSIYQRATIWADFPEIPQFLREKSISSLSEKCSNPDDWQSRLTAAREFILYAAQARREKLSPNSVSLTLNHGANLLREVNLIQPHVLAARFNLIRALLHLGTDLDRIEAINLLNATLAEPLEKWELNRLDHVMPFDFFPHMFDYRNYLHSLANLGIGMVERSRRKKMILSSLHAYRGWYNNNAWDFHEAKRLNPDFINYRLWSARADMINGDWENTAELRADLEAASFDPLTCQQATHLLWTFKDNLYEKGKVPQKILDFADRNEQCLLYVGGPEGNRGSIFESAWYLPGNAFNNEHIFSKTTKSNTNNSLTVIIAPRPRRNYRRLLNSLTTQTLSRNKFNIIWVEPFGVPPNDPSNIIDEITYCGQLGVFDHLNRCYNLALSNVVTPMVLIVDETSPLPNAFLAQVLETFTNVPEVPLVVVATKEYKSKATILENMRLYQGGTVAFRITDLISVGGFDEASSFYGLLSGPFDAAHRIALGPSKFATIDTGNNQEKKRRSHHAFVTEYLESLYSSQRTLPYVEHKYLQKLRTQRQN